MVKIIGNNFFCFWNNNPVNIKTIDEINIKNTILSPVINTVNKPKYKINSIFIIFLVFKLKFFEKIKMVNMIE